MIIAAIMSGALALAYQDSPDAARRIQSCAELENIDSTSQLYEVAGTYYSDGLHPLVILLNCTESRVFVNWSALPEPLNAYLRTAWPRGSAGPTCIPVTLLGHLRPVSGTRNIELVVEDFRGSEAAMASPCRPPGY